MRIFGGNSSGFDLSKKSLVNHRLFDEEFACLFLQIEKMRAV
jgi:hypothetical protein